MLNYFSEFSSESNLKQNLQNCETFQLHDYTCISYIAANIRVAGAFEKSAEVMKNMQTLCKVSEISMSMQEMSKEMMKVCGFMA